MGLPYGRVIGVGTSVPSATWLLLFWMLTFAAWLLAHLRALAYVLRSPSLDRTWKWWCLFPPIVPWAAWKTGARLLPIVWASLGALYGVLRLMD